MQSIIMLLACERALLVSTFYKVYDLSGGVAVGGEGDSRVPLTPFFCMPF